MYGPLFRGVSGSEAWSRMCKQYEAIVKERGTAVNRFLAASVDICYFNVDGAYWEVYSREDDILAEVRAYVDGLEGVECIEQSLLARML